jgi:hypothetical protein
MRAATKRLLEATVLLGVSVATRPGVAFCGVYVSGADAKLFNDASQAARTRGGMWTVLAMHNDYQALPRTQGRERKATSKFSARARIATLRIWRSSCEVEGVPLDARAASI